MKILSETQKKHRFQFPHLIESDFARSPQWILDMFDDYHDVCPSNPLFDGLTTNWLAKNYCNPPYSEKEKWIRKAIEQMKKGKLTVMLLPMSPDTTWYINLVVPNAEILYLHGRIQFFKKSRPQNGSVLAVFHPYDSRNTE